MGLKWALPWKIECDFEGCNANAEGVSDSYDMLVEYLQDELGWQQHRYGDWHCPEHKES